MYKYIPERRHWYIYSKILLDMSKKLWKTGCFPSVREMGGAYSCGHTETAPPLSLFNEFNFGRLLKAVKWHRLFIPPGGD